LIAAAEKLFILDPDRLAALATTLSDQYAQAKPFPHAVIDDFLPAEELRRVAAGFPKPGDIEWHRSSNPRQTKLAVEDERLIDERARWLLYQLNSATFVNFLEKLTRIEGLIPDPYFAGGGLHQIEPGGYLKIHADFNRHEKFQLERRLNVLLYLNEDWKEEYGGHLELWNRDMTDCVQKILPVFNRCVIFNTTDHSYHGHPEPLACPQGITRKSLALYYYSNGRPEHEATSEHGTLTKPRPGETIEGINGRSRTKAAARRLLPPILFDLRRFLTGK
jgi:2OG-Fe(II) oxygenase superfamily